MHVFPLARYSPNKLSLKTKYRSLLSEFPVVSLYYKQFFTSATVYKLKNVFL